ncbi:hypothetical protein QJ48_11145 [Paenibacillus sp. A3]|nr:hypothetical protein QJ48_11145 [Paenibacillus sp. A3]
MHRAANVASLVPLSCNQRVRDGVAAPKCKYINSVKKKKLERALMTAISQNVKKIASHLAKLTG